MQYLQWGIESEFRAYYRLLSLLLTREQLNDLYERTY
jgi:hypothetical protein